MDVLLWPILILLMVLALYLALTRRIRRNPDTGAYYLEKVEWTEPELDQERFRREWEQSAAVHQSKVAPSTSMQRSVGKDSDDGFADSLVLGHATGVTLGRNPVGAIIGANMHDDGGRRHEYGSGRADHRADDHRSSDSYGGSSGSSSDSGGGGGGGDGGGD